jgi:very-short-patch-repair endonuclease
VGDKEQPVVRHGPLFELATEQHGVIATRQLALIGYSRSSASKAHGVQRLRRIHRGVYLVGHERLTWHGRCMAAALACAPAVASHTAAGWLHGLLRRPPETIHLTAPTKRRAKAGFRVHFAALPDREVEKIDGISVTGWARTALDLASMSSAPQIEGMLERSEELKIFDLLALEDVLGRSSRHPGAGRLRRALDIYRPQLAVTRSTVEKRFLALVRKAGLPPPAMNFNVGGFELDAYWAAERFVVELDVYETHGTRAAFERDRQRQDDLMMIGVEMIRVTGPRLEREPRQVIERVASHLRRRRDERNQA